MTRTATDRHGQGNSFFLQADEFAGWIDTLIVARAYVRAGPDERVWLKGQDDGATNTTDGVHYSAAGQTACAGKWRALLGY
jgi:hypothetical protein